uniref:Uncharacterized protein n=1 Tax=Oryzias latipes TaxID=8090 RepID=A0A3B3HJD6_ORYLA
MKSLWNWGSMTCITCFTWLVSHLSINSSRANSLSGPLHICMEGCREEDVLSFSASLSCLCFPFLTGLKGTVPLLKLQVILFYFLVSPLSLIYNKRSHQDHSKNIWIKKQNYF